VDDLLARAELHWTGPLATLGRSLHLVRRADAPASVRASNAAIRQALDVLLDNAVRHGDGAVTVTAERIDGGLVVRVADEGAGPTTTGDDLFRSGRPDEYGHGIGLGLARTLVEAEGGRVRLRDLGRHPAFEIFLPNDPRPVA
jgi:signal transduction histidine kinase